MMRRLLPVLGLLPLAALAHATDPVGAWTGRFIVRKPVYPAGYPAAQKARIAAQIATVERGRMSLVLKGDHTYTMHNVGLGMVNMSEAGGTWTQKGANVQLYQKGTGAGTQRALVLDASGRRMVLTLRQSQAQIVFARA